MSRLAEILGSLTIATDLAAGLPPHTALKTGVVAARLARAAGLRAEEIRDVYYAGLLRFLGATAFSLEMSRDYGGGDDLRIMRALALVEATRPVDALAGAARGLWGKPLVASLTAVGSLAVDLRFRERCAAAQCELAVDLAAKLEMSAGVVTALGQMHERWDGRGHPAKLRGDGIDVRARVLHVASRLAVHVALEGFNGLDALLRTRAGGELDPALAHLAARDLHLMLERLTDASQWQTLLEVEPTGPRSVDDAQLVHVAEVFAWYVDLKSPQFIGHSARVSALARAAGDRLGLAKDVVRALELAGLLHDVGRVVLPNGVLEKRTALTEAEREAIAEHDHQTHRILARTAVFARAARLASSAHERLDGSGYHRGVPAFALDDAARVLACADAYDALVHARAHRPSRDPSRAAARLREEAAAGKLCPRALDAVLASVDAVYASARDAGETGLAAAEVDVVRLAALGLSTKEVARRLRLPRKLVDRHLESIFAKLGGAHTRSRLATFAVTHGIAPGDPDAARAEGAD